MRIACPPQNAAPWCSGLTYCPVKAEIAGSNPVGVATHSLAAGPASAPSSRTPEKRNTVELYGDVTIHDEPLNNVVDKSKRH